MKRIFRVILLALFSFWLVITSYYYLQHKTTIWKSSIDKTFNTNNIQVNITEIYVKNYENKDSFKYIYKYQNLFSYVYKLPSCFSNAIFRIVYFYSSPYKVNRDYGYIGLKGTVILNNYSEQDFRKNYEIGIIDDINKYYSNSFTTRQEDGSNIIEFISEGPNFPLDKLNIDLKIYVKNKQQNEIQQYVVKPQFKKNNYGFFRRMPNDFK